MQTSQKTRRPRRSTRGTALIGAVIVSGVVAAGAAFAQSAPPAPATKLAPLPDAPKIDEKRAALGAKLFFDERLSGDTSTSCATCHDPAKGWGGKPLSDGYSSLDETQKTELARRMSAALQGLIDN